MSGWPVFALGELCEINIGGTPSRGASRYWDLERRTNNVWLSIADLPGGVRPSVADSKEYLSDEGAKRVRTVPAGTLLCSFKLTLGRLAFAEREVRTNEAIAALPIRNKNRLEAEYLYWYLTYFDWAKAAEGEDKVKGKTLNKAKLGVLSVLLPPLEEQRRIVAVLDEAFAAIATATANARTSATLAKATFGGLLKKIFENGGPDWVEEPIHPTVRFIDYRGKTPPKSSSGIRLITAKNVKPGFVQVNPEEFVPAEIYEGWMTRGIPKRGDVLFTTEAPLGNVAQLDTDERVVIGQRLITMQPASNKLDRTFLKYMLTSEPLQEAIRLKATGATVQGIKASLLKLVSIRYPADIAQQRSLVEQLDEVATLTQAAQSNYREKLDLLEQLKRQLLQRTFSGEPTEQELLAA